LGDLNSSAERKNLIGAIEAYRRAFPEVSGASILIVKTQSEDEHPAFSETALNLCEGRSDIRFIRGTRSREEVRSLIASCDVLLSPHRSEGYGLSLAEAFVEGVPALATGWSGNMDFMSGVRDLLISYSLVPVRDAYGIYRHDRQLWAEPDLDDAARKLRTLAANSHLRTSLAQEGRKAVLAQAEAWRGRVAFGDAVDRLVRMPAGRAI
jgi:glycosyltransferase involved in cell wall biosynthesis